MILSRLWTSSTSIYYLKAQQAAATTPPSYPKNMKRLAATLLPFALVLSACGSPDPDAEACDLLRNPTAISGDPAQTLTDLQQKVADPHLSGYLAVMARDLNAGETIALNAIAELGVERCDAINK